MQFRTLSMDLRASLEHKISYKKDLPEDREVERQLFECTQLSAEKEQRILFLRQ